MTAALAAVLIASCAGSPATPEETPEKVVTTSDRTGAETAQKAADAARTRADAEKAGVAAKDEYDAAAGVYSKAQADLSASRFEEAIASFKQAEQGFDASAKLAADRKAAAQAAMNKADASIQTTEERLKAIEQEIGPSGGAL
jgi:multidrug resistance efflux pump